LLARYPRRRQLGSALLTDPGVTHSPVELNRLLTGQEHVI
jgi:hypothetical protein